MTGEPGTGTVQGFQLFIGEVALERQGAIDGGAGVALGADQFIPVRFGGILISSNLNYQK